MVKQLDLPSIYKEREKNPVPERYKKYIGRPAISYSTYTAFKEEGYRGEWLANKFLGIPSEGSIFTEYGGAIGTYQETGIPQPYLSQFDLETLDKEIPANPLAEYEREVLIDRGSFIVYGFVDRLLGVGSKIVDLVDFKTGSIEKKAKEYASKEYKQTGLYSYALEEEGFTIKSSSVVLFDRKGNTLEQGNKNVLRLTGAIEYIPTPYVREDIEEFLLELDETAKKIEKYWKLYKEVFGTNN